MPLTELLHGGILRGLFSILVVPRQDCSGLIGFTEQKSRDLAVGPLGTLAALSPECGRHVSTGLFLW